MKMTFTKSQFEMPDGKYLAKFMGTTLREATGQLDQRGNPLPPGMTWDFEIVEGDQTGKKVDKLTGRMPTPKSGCGKFLAAISDTVLKDGMEVDLSNYVSKLYRITVIENRVSDNPAPTRVYDQAPASTSSNGGPPPKKKIENKVETPAARLWYVDVNPSGDGEPVKLAEPDIIEQVHAQKIDPSVAVVAADGSDEWQPMKTAIPATGVPF